MITQNLRIKSAKPVIQVKNQIILEYSPKQQCFHKSTLAEMVTNNIKLILRQQNNGYIPIGLFSSHEDCDQFIKLARPLFEAAADRASSFENNIPVLVAQALRLCKN